MNKTLILKCIHHRLFFNTKVFYYKFFHCSLLECILFSKQVKRWTLINKWETCGTTVSSFLIFLLIQCPLELRTNSWSIKLTIKIHCPHTMETFTLLDSVWFIGNLPIFRSVIQVVHAAPSTFSTSWTMAFIYQI